MIITRGYGEYPTGTGPGGTLVLVDGLNVMLDNVNIIVDLSSPDYTVNIDNDNIELYLDYDEITSTINTSDTIVDMTGDNLIIDVKCGSTLVPKEELMQKITGENVGGLRVVTVDDNGHIIHATVPRVLDGKPVIGITTEAEFIGNLCDIGVTGDEIIEPSWTWDVNESIYLGDDGNLTQIPPITNFVQLVAVPLSPTSLRVRIEPPIFL